MSNSEQGTLQLRKMGDDTIVTLTIGTFRVHIVHTGEQARVSTTARGQTSHTREDLGREFALSVNFPLDMFP